MKGREEEREEKKGKEKRGIERKGEREGKRGRGKEKEKEKEREKKRECRTNKISYASRLSYIHHKNPWGVYLNPFTSKVLLGWAVLFSCFGYCDSLYLFLVRVSGVVGWFSRLIEFFFLGFREWGCISRLTCKSWQGYRRACSAFLLLCVQVLGSSWSGVRVAATHAHNAMMS